MCAVRPHSRTPIDKDSSNTGGAEPEMGYFQVDAQDAARFALWLSVAASVLVITAARAGRRADDRERGEVP